MAKPRQKFYVVWKGKHPGVYHSWDECQRQIRGFTGARYMSFKTKDAAEKAFQGSHSDYIGKDVFETELSAEELARIGRPIEESIAVDAAFDGKVMEYQGVYTKTRQVLFKFGPFEDATNNIGEFLAIVHALGYLKKQGSAAPVYSDSQTATKWVRDQHANTKLPRTAANQSLFYLIERAMAWLKTNRYPNRLLKWETRAWGEIPADFGRK